LFLFRTDTDEPASASSRITVEPSSKSVSEVAEPPQRNFTHCTVIESFEFLSIPIDFDLDYGVPYFDSIANFFEPMAQDHAGLGDKS
jgi:hypothetical protein